MSRQLATFTSDAFDQFSTGTGAEITAFHWAEGRELLFTLCSFYDKPFYFCDDPHKWASPWVAGMHLYAFRARLARPMVYLNENRPLEGGLSYTYDALKAVGYDSLLYTAPADIADRCGHVRQGVLFDAANQVFEIALLG